MTYNELTLQNYLCSERNSMTKKEKIFAFTARANMLDVRGNFKTGKKDINCRLGCDTVEDQNHIYNCDALKDDYNEENLSYNDIYGNDLEKIRRVTQRLMKKFLKLTTTMHRQTDPCAAMADDDTDVSHTSPC